MATTKGRALHETVQALSDIDSLQVRLTELSRMRDQYVVQGKRQLALYLDTLIEQIEREATEIKAGVPRIDGSEPR